MRFPNLAELALPATFEQVIPGRLHPDGSRYLPIIGLRLDSGGFMGVVDRHHRVDLAQAGARGIARLVFLLSSLRLQTPPARLAALSSADAHAPALRWTASGQIVALPTWEQQRLFDTDRVYAEAHVDVGLGRVGVRTTLTAPHLATLVGADRLSIGDWITISHSRIDILGFEPQLAPAR